jgi:DNA-binding NtrC family response regulator
VSARRPLAEVLIGQSAIMEELRATIVRYARSPLPVLILGPRGAGKELVAQALHDESGRPGAFVAFNTCAIADSMFEDALFGHVRGAFTGATHDAVGYLSEAHRGTAFFDEITGISLANQRKLLRVFETRAFRPVGGRVDRTSDFRLLSATNDDLGGMVDSGSFRADLADRLGVVAIHVPPLRDRRSDIPALVAHFLGEVVIDVPVSLSAAALRTLESYDWPGNVRQLRHVLHRAALAARAPVVGCLDVESALGLGAASLPARADRADRVDFERRRLVALMESVNWSVERAAGVLAVHPTTVYRRLRRLNLATRPWDQLPEGISTDGSRAGSVNSDGSRAS